MSDYLRGSFYFKRLPELKKFFDKSPFADLRHSDEPKQRMLDCGFIGNLAMRFWRLLEVNNLLRGKENHDIYCDFLLEKYLNSAQACVDAMAAALNHFLGLGCKSSGVALQKDAFIKKLKSKLQSNGISLPTCLDANHKWVKSELYPYRNIVHHMGDFSKYAALDPKDMSFACTLVPRIGSFDFSEIYNNMSGYPSYTAWLIVHGQMKIPNRMTGDKGDADKYYPIDQFFKEWIEKTYHLLCCFTEIIVSYQKKTI